MKNYKNAIVIALSAIIAVLAAIISPGGTVHAATSTIIPLHAIRSDDCNGGTVEIAGTIHLVSQLQSDGSVVGHFNYQGVSAINRLTGASYQVAAVDHFRLSAPFPSSISSVRHFYLIGQGSTTNLLVTARFHITVDGNGTVRASWDDLAAQCVG